MQHDYTRIACTTCGDIIDVPIFCGDRFCPVCSVVRKSRIRNRLFWLIANCPKDPADRFRHLTLTISSQADLPAMIKKLLASFRKLRQRAWWKQKVNGGAFVIEVTGHPGAWHAHIHAIVYGRWMQWDHLLKLWKAVSGGIGVYVSHIPEAAAVGYLTKYLTKPDCPDLVAADIAEGLKGVRMFSVFGSWHKLNLTYVKPKHPCEKCGGEFWCNYDILAGNYPKTYSKDFDISPRSHPPNEKPDDS